MGTQGQVPPSPPEWWGIEEQPRSHSQPCCGGSSLLPPGTSLGAGCIPGMFSFLGRQIGAHRVCSVPVLGCTQTDRSGERQRGQAHPRPSWLCFEACSITAGGVSADVRGPHGRVGGC